MDMTLRCPDQDGVLTICDYSKTDNELTGVSLTALEDGRSFSAARADGQRLQAQYVRPGQSYDPQGNNVFTEPVKIVPVLHDFVTERWRVEVDPANVADPAGLNMLVWALAHYGLKKKDKLLASVSN